MRLQMSTSVSAEEWNARVSSFGGNIFHTTFWADYIKANNPRTTPKFFSIVSDREESLGVALGFEESSSHHLFSPLTRRLWFDSMPAISGARRGLHEFPKLIESYALSSGYLELEMGSYASYDAINDLKALNFDLIERLEFEFCLGVPMEDLWKRIGNKRRNIIKKAEKAGVTIQDMPGEDGLFALRQLKEETNKRILLKGGPESTFKPIHTRDPLNVLVESGVGRTIVARVNEEIVSAGFFIHFNELVYYMIAGHSSKGLEMQAPSLLVWESMKTFQKEGWKRFSLGGCKISAMDQGSPEHGVYLFKKRFKADALPCANGLKVFHKTRQKILEICRNFEPPSIFEKRGNRYSRSTG